MSPGCANCYAERMAMRFTGHFNVTCHPDRLDQPLHWKKPRRIFVCSMGDLFHEDVPDEFILKIFQVMCRGSWSSAALKWHHPHTFLVLTKRPKRMLQFWKKHFYGDPCPESVWLGITAENQEQADKRIPILLQIPTAKRFVSIEPMLRAVDIVRYLPHPLPKHKHREGTEKPDGVFHFYKYLDWVIVGAESGPKRRECKIEWVRDALEQCQAAGIPAFIKQLHINGKLSKKMAEWPEDLQIQDHPS